jgi:hypothetical protein
MIFIKQIIGLKGKDEPREGVREGMGGLDFTR